MKAFNGKACYLVIELRCHSRRVKVLYQDSKHELDGSGMSILAWLGLKGLLRAR